MDKKYLIVGTITALILVGAACNKTTNNIPAPQTTKQETTQKTITTEKQINTPDSQFEISANIKINDDVKNKATVSIPVAKPTLVNKGENSENCLDQKCFEKKFTNCQKATFLAKVEGFEAEYLYTITGPKDGKCEMKTKYTKNPDPEWTNKEMICLYDNQKPFLTATDELMQKNNSICSGDLAKILTSL